jgi:hypothetical protein
MASYADVLHLHGRPIARPKLAVDRQVEHRKLASVGRHLQSRSNRPDFSQLQRRLLATQPPLVPRHPTSGGRIKRFHDKLLFNEGRSIVRLVEWSIFDHFCRSTRRDLNGSFQESNCHTGVRGSQRVLGRSGRSQVSCGVKTSDMSWRAAFKNLERAGRTEHPSVNDDAALLGFIAVITLKLFERTADIG